MLRSVPNSLRNASLGPMSPDSAAHTQDETKTAEMGRESCETRPLFRSGARFRIKNALPGVGFLLQNRTLRDVVAFRRSAKGSVPARSGGEFHCPSACFAGEQLHLPPVARFRNLA